MKRLFFYPIFALLIMVAFSSCSTKQHCIRQLENLSEELDNNGQYYTVGDWEDAAEKLVKIRKNINKHRYTQTERRKIGRLEGDCVAAVAKGLKGQAKNLGSELKGILESLMDLVKSWKDDE
ncbi:MAG: hypothetical protein IJL45_07230 [Prevotella sp.]|nr:hypothetical protein [Prevotella sp.]MBQ6161597.1 hypothetical protein [Prevotella sp.]